MVLLPDKPTFNFFCEAWPRTFLNIFASQVEVLEIQRNENENTTNVYLGTLELYFLSRSFTTNSTEYSQLLKTRSVIQRKFSFEISSQPSRRKTLHTCSLTKKKWNINVVDEVSYNLVVLMKATALSLCSGSGKVGADAIIR